MPNNLPAQVTSFVGRDGALVELRGLLDAGRVVTVTGAGGVGKTRLALQAGAELLDGSGDGVWLVELAPLADPDLVAATVASVLQVREEPGRPALETLVDALRERAMLIVLDNCEHVLDAVAKVAERLIQTCPGVEILATSREPLGSRASTCTASLPCRCRRPTPASTSRASPSTKPCSSSSTARRSTGRASRSTRPMRMQSCPCAHTSTASRSRSSSPRPGFARSPSRRSSTASTSDSSSCAAEAVPRSRATRLSESLIAWSYDLLLDHERVALDRLSVFAGGWDLDAAETVIAGDDLAGQGRCSTCSGALVDKSLVQAELRGESTRYRLLETIRQYATAQLTKRGDAELLATAIRHRDHFLDLAERVGGPSREGEAEWFERIALEHDNVRAALATAARS